MRSGGNVMAVGDHMPAERPVIGSVPKRTGMPNPAHNRADPPARPAEIPASRHRLSTARGVVVGVILGLLAWGLLGMLGWLLL
jgi:hypothetical protein